MKPSLENFTWKKRGGAPIVKKVSKKKKLACDDVSSAEDVDIDLDVVNVVAASEAACDAEVRLISYVFSSGETPSLLTALVECFQNLGREVRKMLFLLLAEVAYLWQVD